MADLHVRDLVVRYGHVVAVDGVSFDVAEGEFVALLGPSGCGKTTTLRCIAGLESASAGEIRIGNDVVARDGRETPPERRGVNMVFQSYAVWPHMTVFDNVAYGLRVQGLPRADVQARTDEALRLVGLGGFERRYGTELSGGQQQRVAVARAVVTAPRLLLFDEPLSNLDAGLRERMRFELVGLQRRLGRTSVYVTHDQAEAMVMSDRIILMNRGKIVQESSPRELYERPTSRFAAEFVGSANLVEARVDGPGRIVIGDLVLHARSAGETPRQSGLLACIRPENIVPVAETSGENVFEARVTRVSFLGATVNCELAVGGLTLRAEFPARTRVNEGTTLHVRIDPAAVVLVSDDA
ncbi:MAG TPA: ABC transporter ATP-binding protein [Acetobacteraceae bacterium]|jgi:ABC-type Fe3+/spermidine/putrescine transport system ATPase subunit|nr:ABC transporter ATP-binding protein [Acetobacteraceae bacterium]